MDSRGQIVQRKDYIILSGEELSTSKRLFPVIDQIIHFQRYKFIQEVGQQTKSLSSQASLETQTSTENSSESQQQ